MKNCVIIQWVFPRSCNGFANINISIVFDSAFAKAAAEHGHLAVLKWLRDQHCPWDERVLDEAYEKGYKDMFEWARSHRCPLSSRLQGLLAPNKFVLKGIQHKSSRTNGAFDTIWLIKSIP